MLKCEAKMVDDMQDVKIELDEDSNTIEVMALLAAICCTVLEKLKASFNLSVEDTVRGFAEMIICALEGKEE